MISDEEVQRLRSLSDEMLKGELGRALAKQRQGGLQARPPSLKRLIEEANAWLEAESNKLRDVICRDAKIREVATSKSGTNEKLVRVVVDAISGILIYLPVGTIAEILVREGIPKYCESVWAST